MHSCTDQTGRTFLKLLDQRIFLAEHLQSVLVRGVIIVGFFTQSRELLHQLSHILSLAMRCLGQAASCRHARRTPLSEIISSDHIRSHTAKLHAHTHAYTPNRALTVTRVNTQCYLT